jgi:hypothetical protein
MSEKTTLRSSLNPSQVASAVEWGERGKGTAPLPTLLCSVKKLTDDLHAGFLLLFIDGFLPLPAVIN